MDEQVGRHVGRQWRIETFRWGRGGHPDPEIRGGGAQKIFFQPFGAHVGLKEGRGGSHPDPEIRWGSSKKFFFSNLGLIWV